MDNADPMRPNILLIMTDQQRWDSLGCYGQRAIETPKLDRLAAAGARFDACYTPCPICTPARASLMTGQHVLEHGVTKLYDVLDAGAVLFPELLRNAGYRTALFGKLHVSSGVHEQNNRHPHDGFDVYDYCIEASVGMDSPYNGYVRWLAARDPAFLEELRTKRRGLKHIPAHLHFTRWATAQTIDFIESASATQPFFCMMSVFDPHNPYDQFPAEYAARVDPAPLRRVIAPAAGDASIYALQQERSLSYLGPADRFTSDDILAMRVGYYASLALLDDEVGRVLAALDRTGLAENTLVIFVSDHGDSLGDHGLFVKGVHLYDEAIRVPLLMRWPARIPAGRVILAPVQLHDIAATVLAAAGIERPAAMRSSTDLLPLATGKADGVHPFVTCIYRNTGINDAKQYFDPPLNSTMIRTQRYKLIVYHAVMEAEIPVALQLFDLAGDPHEQHNLIGDPAHTQPLVDSLATLIDWLQTQSRALESRRGEALPTVAWSNVIQNRFDTNAS
jgi:arylsulfatase A-like enzyme